MNAALVVGKMYGGISGKRNIKNTRDRNEMNTCTSFTHTLAPLCLTRKQICGSPREEEEATASGKLSSRRLVYQLCNAL